MANFFSGILSIFRRTKEVDFWIPKVFPEQEQAFAYDFYASWGPQGPREDESSHYVDFHRNAVASKEKFNTYAQIALFDPPIPKEKTLILAEVFDWPPIGEVIFDFQTGNVLFRPFDGKSLVLENSLMHFLMKIQPALMLNREIKNRIESLLAMPESNKRQKSFMEEMSGEQFRWMESVQEDLRDFDQCALIALYGSWPDGEEFQFIDFSTDFEESPSDTEKFFHQTTFNFWWPPTKDRTYWILGAEHSDDMGWLVQYDPKSCTVFGLQAPSLLEEQPTRINLADSFEEFIRRVEQSGWRRPECFSSE